MQIFASSPGWKEKLPTRSHRRLPLISVPTTGSMGESSSKMPSSTSTYLYWANRSMFFRNTSTSTMQAMPAYSHIN